MDGRAARVRIVNGALVLTLLWLPVGCEAPPEGVSWRDDVRVFKPTPQVTWSAGYLEVETGMMPPVSDETAPQALPFYVFSEEGRFLEDARGGRTRLRPGKYIVVSRVRSVNKQVQVVIEAGRTTHVSKKDLEEGFSIER